MSKNEQRLIVIASIDKDGNIEVKQDFHPKMPETKEAFDKLPEGRRGAVSVINQLAKQNQLAIKGLAMMAAEADTPPISEVSGNVEAVKT